MEQPSVSIVIPIYNEAEILLSSMEALLSQLEERLAPIRYEVLLCENGSTDGTCRISQDLAQRWSAIRVTHLPVASYGQALKHGITQAAGDIIVVFNADFWDVGFLCQSLPLLEEFDFVIGSKNLKSACDRRPLHRRVISVYFNFLLHVLFGFQGTDTHGLKAMRAESAKKLAGQCVTDAEIFDTELVLRSQLADMRVTELPISVEEQRPSRYGLLRRTPKTLMDLITLIRVLGIQGKTQAKIDRARM